MFNNFLLVLSYMFMLIMSLILLVKALTWGIKMSLRAIEKDSIAEDTLEISEEAVEAKTPQQKRELTNIRKYGVRNVSSLKSVKEKRKDTVLMKYGVPYTYLLSPKKKNQNRTMAEIACGWRAPESVLRDLKRLQK